MALASQQAPSEVHPAFDWLRSEPVASLGINVEEYRHRKTGAVHYHLAAQSEENVFLVALRTVPMDSTGVAHILEHTALCGSERYPVRDPFFMMIRRSLNTFMNAFTSSDWTAYPFASQNRKDFFNLLDVYLDAVFFARLHELDFAQEGHRLEFASADDPGSELLFKGVVFNEMKGAMSAASSVLWHTLSKYLFPTTTYHYNSGGEPECIPDLSYAGLKDFYRTHYHPSNAVFMTYGDLPAIEHHARFEQRALSRFEALDTHIAVPDEKRYLAPVVVEESYAVAAEEAQADKTHLVMGWLLGTSTDLHEQLEAHLLSGVLLDDGASPLRRALETSELGSAPSPLCGLEDSNREMTFMCGLEGSRPEHAPALEALVFGVLEEVAAKGIAHERLEAVLHQLELSQREVGGDGFPYGLQLILNGLSGAVHRGDPVAMLNLDPVLEQLRERITDPDYIRDLVRRLLLDNQHRVRLTLRPDTGLAARRDQAEAQRLARIKAALDDAGRARIIDQAARLAARQKQKDDPDVLPKVGLDDVPAELKYVPGEEGALAGMPATFFDQGTNGLVYQQVVCRLPALSADELALFPALCSSLTELGVGDRDYLETQAWQSSVSGGLGSALSMRARVDDVQSVSGNFVLSGKALARNQAGFAELLHETWESVRFDELARIRELIAQERAHREQSVTGNGHVLAMTAATSGLSPSAALSHRLHGLEGIHQLKRLDDSLETADRLAGLGERLAQVHRALRVSPARMLVIGEPAHNAEVRPLLEALWRERRVEAGEALSLAPVSGQVRQMWITNTQVNFCARAYPTVAFSHPDAAPLTVLGGLLRNGYLHGAIRERGGAYGGGASHDADTGAFRFFSYRDPRLQETLEDFERALEWLHQGGGEWRLVEEAILGVIGALDKPASPAGEARKSFYNNLYGRTPELRQQFREAVLRVTLAEVQRVAAHYLEPERASVAVITNAATLASGGDLGLEVHHL